MTIYSQASEQLEYLAFTYHLIWTKELTGLEHDTHYYGSKYGRGAHPNTLWVGYHTSSEYVANFRKQYGEPDVRKIKKKFHGLPHCKETGDIVTAYESQVLTRMNAAARPDYLNESNGCGKFNTAGMVPVKDSEGNIMLVSKHDTRYLNGDLINVNARMVTVKDSLGHIMQVSTDDPSYLNGDLIPVSKGLNIGLVSAKDKDGNTMKVSMDDPRWVQGELVGANKGTFTAKDKDGNTMKVSMDNPRYLNGDLVGAAAGYTKENVTVKDKDGNNVQISKNDPRFGVTLFGTNKGMIAVKDGFGNKYLVPREDPLIGNTLLGVASKQIFATTAAGERIHASPKDKRWSSKQITRGW